MFNMRKVNAFAVLIAMLFGGQAGLRADDWSWLDRPFVPHYPVRPVDLSNSPLIRQLLRAGNIYLSLTDAITLAIQNNLDVELQRYGLPAAEMEVVRAKGGGLPRGILYNVYEVPVGVGGPASPLVTTVAAPEIASGAVPTNPSELGALVEQQDNLETTGTISYATGSPVPIFDPAINGQFSWTHQTTPESNPFSVNTNNLISTVGLANSGFVQGFSTGTQINMGFNNSVQSLNSAIYPYSPFTSSNLGFTITQPLLRGFGIALNRRFIRIAQNEQRISNLLLQQQLIATVYGVVRLYTDLVALYEDVKVQEETLASAEKLYSDTQARVEEGTQAPIELTRANAQVYAIRQDLIDARGLLEEQEAIVKNVITRRTANDPELLTARIIPTDTIEVPATDEIRPIQDLLADAYTNRPDLQQAGLQTTNSKIYLEGDRNNLLPEIDLVGIAQNNSLVGQINPLATNVTTNFIGGYGTALDQLFSARYPTYGVGINITLPLRNRIAQSDLARDQVQLQQTQIREQQLRNQAQLEVQDALIAMRRARSSYDAALKTQALQQESLEAEQAKFDVGASTSFFIIQYESYLAQARSTVVVAKSAYLKARAALERATGSILQAYNVSLDEATRGR